MPSDSVMTTVLPRAAPVVISLCACAAIGALIAPMTAATASILFRMSNSFEVMHAGFAQHAIPTQFIACGIVPGKSAGSTLQFSAVFAGGGTR